MSPTFEQRHKFCNILATIAKNDYSRQVCSFSVTNLSIVYRRESTAVPAVQQWQQCNSGSSATVHVLQHSSSVTNAQKDVQVFKKLRQTFEKFKVSSSVDKSHRTKIFCLSSLCAKIFETASMTLKTFFQKSFFGFKQIPGCARHSGIHLKKGTKL